MQRHITILILLALLAAPLARAQAPADKKLNLYVVAGMRLLSDKSFGYSESVSPAAAPTLGAGATWQRNRILLSGEFNFTDAKKDTDEFGTILTGVSANVLVGYAFILSRNTALQLQSGFGYSLYHLAVADNGYQGSANLNTTVYHNVVYSVPVSALVQRKFSNGTFAGIRAGYNIPLQPSEWRYIEGSTTEVSVAGTDGVFIQVLFGGIFSLANR